MPSKRRTSGSIQPLGDGRYRVMASAPPDPVTLKRRRLSRVVDGGVRAAEKALDALKVEAGMPAQARGLTLKSYLEGMWYPHLEERLAQGKIRELTISGYRSKLDHHVIPYLGIMNLPEVDPYSLDRWLGKLAKAGVGQHTRHHVYRVFHTALHQAVKWRILASNPLDSVEAPKATKYAFHVLDSDRANALLDTFVGHPIEAIVILALGAGMRRSEAAAIDWSDIDFTAGTVSTWRGLHADKDHMWYEDNKTERSKRTISLPEWALDGLRPMRGFGPLVMDGAERMDPRRISYLFRRHLRGAIKEQEATELLKPEADRKPPRLRDIPLKDLRHSNATIALAQGAKLIDVSRHLGHSTVMTTDTYYVKTGRAEEEDVAAKMGSIRTLRPEPDTVCHRVPNA